MNLDELLRWKAENQAELTAFLHNHRELSGMHFMAAADGAGYIEFSLKYEQDTAELDKDIRDAFGTIEFAVTLVDQEAFRRKA
jgi:hypothetical protein